MNGLTSVLLEVQTLNAHNEGIAVFGFNFDLALTHDRVLELGNLVALRKVRIEIVFTVKTGPEIDLRIQTKTRTNRLLNAATVDNRQHAGHGCIDEADIAVRVCTEFRWRAGKQLGIRRDLRVNFHADHDFPVTGITFNNVARTIGHSWSQISESITCVFKHSLVAASTSTFDKEEQSGRKSFQIICSARSAI